MVKQMQGQTQMPAQGMENVLFSYSCACACVRVVHTYSCVFSYACFTCVTQENTNGRKKKEHWCRIARNKLYSLVKAVENRLAWACKLKPEKTKSQIAVVLKFSNTVTPTLDQVNLQLKLARKYLSFAFMN